MEKNISGNFKTYYRKPDEIEDKGLNDFNYYKTIEGISYKIFCVKEEDRFLIKSAIKE